MAKERKTVTKKTPKKNGSSSKTAPITNRKFLSILRFKKRRAQSDILPGYVGFSKEVLRTLTDNKKLFLRLTLLFWVASLVIFGAAQQSQFQALRDSVSDLTTVVTNFDQKSLAVAALTLSIFSGGLNAAFTEAQQGYAAVFYLFVWLAVIWLVRHLLSGSVVKVRDGLYNAGGPIIATVLVSLFGILQLLPMAIGVAVYAAVNGAGVSNPFILLFVFAILLLLTALSLYWLVSTLFALILTTLPGSYPVYAIRSANKIVKGVRLKVLYRVLWLTLILSVFSLIILAVAVAINIYFNIALLPLLVSQLLTITGLVYASSYIYLLYRKIIDERG